MCYLENNMLSLSINLSSLSSCSFASRPLKNNPKSAFNLSPPSFTLHLTWERWEKLDALSIQDNLNINWNISLKLQCRQKILTNNFSVRCIVIGIKGKYHATVCSQLGVVNEIIVQLPQLFWWILHLRAAHEYHSVRTFPYSWPAMFESAERISFLYLAFFILEFILAALVSALQTFPTCNLRCSPTARYLS